MAAGGNYLRNSKLEFTHGQPRMGADQHSFKHGQLHVGADQYRHPFLFDLPHIQTNLTTNICKPSKPPNPPKHSTLAIPLTLASHPNPLLNMVSSTWEPTNIARMVIVTRIGFAHAAAVDKIGGKQFKEQ